MLQTFQFESTQNNHFKTSLETEKKSSCSIMQENLDILLKYLIEDTWKKNTLFSNVIVIFSTK